MKIHSNISSNTKDAHPGKNLIEQKYLKVLLPSVILLYQLKKVVNRADYFARALARPYFSH